MTKLDAGLTYEEAEAFLREHNKEEFHLAHGATVSGVMGYFAKEIDPENEDFWRIVGLLHDVGWEEYPTPEDHTIKGAEMIAEAGGSDDLIHAIQTHNSTFNEACPAPELEMEKVLFATDELTGLIGAAVIMRPSKSVMDFEVKSLKKKFKDKKVAAGCSRDVIRSGADMLGWELDDLFARTIEAMRSFAPDREA